MMAILLKPCVVTSFTAKLAMSAKEGVGASVSAGGSIILPVTGSAFPWIWLDGLTERDCLKELCHCCDVAGVDNGGVGQAPEEIYTEGGVIRDQLGQGSGVRGGGRWMGRCAEGRRRSEGLETSNVMSGRPQRKSTTVPLSLDQQCGSSSLN